MFRISLSSFEYFKKIDWQHLSDSDWWHSSWLIWYNIHPPWRTTSSIQINEEHQHFLIRIPILCMVTFGPFCWQNPCSGVLIVTVEFIWLLFLNILSFNFVITPNKSLRLTKLRRTYHHDVVLIKVTVLFCLMYTVQNGHVPFL